MQRSDLIEYTYADYLYLLLRVSDICRSNGELRLDYTGRSRTINLIKTMTCGFMMGDSGHHWTTHLL